MKIIKCFFIMILSVSFCSATEYSKYAAKNYAEYHNKEKVHITVKKEHKFNYFQKINNHTSAYFVYGYGDLKCKNNKKQRITYICLLDKDKKAFWSSIYKSE